VLLAEIIDRGVDFIARSSCLLQPLFHLFASLSQPIWITMCPSSKSFTSSFGHG